MPDRDKSTLAIDSDAVDAEFWSLVLHDEELLRAEFDEITEPAEARISPPCAIPVAADQSSSSGEGPRAPDRGAPDRLANAARRPGPRMAARTFAARRRQPARATNRQLSRQGR